MIRSPGFALEGDVGEVGGLALGASVGVSATALAEGWVSCVPGLLRSPT